MTTMTMVDEIMLAAPGEPIVNITAHTARQKASGYAGSYISHLMGGGEPSLLFSQNRLIWRVPLLLTSPQQGIVGTVGSLDVDARTSQLIVPPDLAEQVKAHAQALINRTAP